MNNMQFSLTFYDKNRYEQVKIQSQTGVVVALVWALLQKSAIKLFKWSFKCYNKAGSKFWNLIVKSLWLLDFFLSQSHQFGHFIGVHTRAV